MAVIEAGSMLSYKTPFSFTWTLNDTEVDSIRSKKSLKSPCFSVLLPPTPSQPELNSLWHLLLWENDMFLCQGWQPDDLYASYVCPPEKGSMYIQKCCFSFEGQLSRNDTQRCYFEVNNEKPIKLVRAEIITLHQVNRLGQGFLRAGKTFRVEVEINVEFHAPLGFPSDEVSQSIYKLYKNKVLTDTAIKCGDKEFKVHRAVLASRSPVFQAMFEVDMKEKQSGVIEVSDITPEAMSDLVTYLYTGTTPNLKTLASELLEAAEKYQLPHLLTKCENELGRNIKDTNVVEMLLLADLHGRSALKRACFNFIRCNSANVFQTSEWADFKEHKVSLLVEVLENVLTPK